MDKIVWIGSPNRSKGRRGCKAEAVVIHIMDQTLAWTDAWFKNASSKVSAHYGVGRKGEIHQWVGEADTAWHAGRRYRATWKLIRPENANFYTLGIEHEAYEDSVWSQAMIDASRRLTAGICNRWHIPIDRKHIIGHREIYARKSCPGNWLDLDWFVDQVRRTASERHIYNFVSVSGTVVSEVNLNMRRGAPTTVVPVVRTAFKGTELPYVGWVSNGLAVHGNAHWYRDERGDFFWAGGTSIRVPSLK